MTLTDLPATELAPLLANRDISAVEVTAAYLARIEEMDGGINAIPTVDAKGALATAEALDQSDEPVGPLHGVPMVVKDIFPTRGVRTTYGSRAMADHVPDADAAHVARLRAAGVVILGKSNTPEFAFGGQTDNPVFGITCNPLDPAKTVGGSSGGAAAALAAGMTALADGSDLGGSLRAPAAWCGVVGFRPSAGVVPYAPRPRPFDALHVVGPMGRSVADVALMLDAMSGPDPADPLSLTAPKRDPLEHAPRVGWCMTPGGCLPEQSIRSALKPAVGAIVAQGSLVERVCPAIGDMSEAQHIFRAWSAVCDHGALVDEYGDLIGPELRRAVADGRRLTAQDLAHAEAIKAECWGRLADTFNEFELLVWPTTCGPAFDIKTPITEIKEDWRPVELTPGLDLPALTLPFGMAEGMPVGLQILGPRGSDATILAFGQALEEQLKS